MTLRGSKVREEGARQRRKGMRHMKLAAFRFLLVLVAGLAIGCSEETTAPPNKQLPAAGSHLWSKSFGDGDTQSASTVSTDAAGNVIVAGDFYGTVDFGGGALTSAGSADVFVAKFGPDGTHLWSKGFGDGNAQFARAVATDASGNVIVAGFFAGAVDFGGGALTSAGREDVYVAKFDPDGTHLWSKSFGDGNAQAAYAVFADASGNVIVAGDFDGSIDFGGGAFTCAGGMDGFVAKLDPDGAHLWSKSFGDASDQHARAVTADASRNVIVTGDFAGSVDFGGGALASAGGADIFIAKFDPDGAHLWSKRFGDGNSQVAYAVSADASGNAVLAGHFQGSVDFGGGALASASNWDIYIAKFDPDGAHIWSKSFNDDNAQYAAAARTDASGNVIIAGYYAGAVDFGGGTLTGADDTNVFVAKFDPDGTHLWSKGFGGPNAQYAYAVSTDASGDVIIAGMFYGTIDFGGGELASQGNWNIFVAKFRR
jgi:hypothetical protein